MANAVTSFATILAGVFTVSFWCLLRDQPVRWLHAYLWIFITGIPTLGLHGYGEPFRVPSHPYWSVADTGTNLLLAWAIQAAVLGDFWSRRVQWQVASASLGLNLLAIANMVRERFFLEEITYLIPLGDFGGFRTGEVMLIVDSLFVTALLIHVRKRMPKRARPLLGLVALTFVCGMLLATAGNEQVGVLFGVPVGAFHAIWHLVSGFGFLAFYVLNHVRFNESDVAALA
jgi:hypothetical protein